MIRKINYRGEWIDCTFSNDEVDEIRKQSIEDNQAIASSILARTVGWIPEVQAVLIQQATQHFVFKLDEIAYEKVEISHKKQKDEDNNG